MTARQELVVQEAAFEYTKAKDAKSEGLTDNASIPSPPVLYFTNDQFDVFMAQRRRRNNDDDDDDDEDGESDDDNPSLSAIQLQYTRKSYSKRKQFGSKEKHGNGPISRK